MRKCAQCLPHLSWCQRSCWVSPRCRVPRSVLRSDKVPCQQELPIGQRYDPGPILNSGQIGAVRGQESQLLFEETEEVLNSEAQQIHQRQVGQGNVLWAAPEEPQGTFVAWRTVSLQELHLQHQANQQGQVSEVQVVPGRQPDDMAEEIDFALPFWCPG